MFPYGIDNSAPERTSLVVALIVVNVLFFAAQILIPGTNALAFVPASREPLTWLASQFLHGGLEHLLGNMYALWLFGPGLSYRLGRWFLPFYLGGGLAANALHLLSGPSSTVPCVGASGAICAVIGAYIFIFPEARMKLSRALWGESLRFNISAPLFGVSYVLLQSLGAMGGGDGDVAYWAHLGGLGFGACVSQLVPGEKEAAAAERSEAAAAGTAAVRAALAVRDDEAAARQFSSEIARDAGFEMATAAEQLAAGAALYRAGRAHLAQAALERVVQRRPYDAEAARAQLMLGDLELVRFKEFAASGERYRLALEHPAADPETRREAAAGRDRARAALSVDAPIGAAAEAPCAVLFEAAPPLSEAQRAAAAGILDLDAGPKSGYLARGLAYVRASAAAGELDKAGVPAVVVPETSLLKLGPAVVAESIRVEAAEARVSHGAPLPHDRLLLVAVVWSGRTIHEAVAAGLLDVVVEDEAPELRAVKRLLPRLELVAADGRRVRWEPEDDGEKSLGALRGLVDELSLRAPKAHLDWGARALLEGRRPEASCFEDAELAGAYLDWQAQLARLKSGRAYGRVQIS